MKKPVIMKNDVILVSTAIIYSTIGAFIAYRFGRKCEIDELINIASEEGIGIFTFSRFGKKTKVSIQIKD